jgi:hypothetical protein
MCGKTTLCKFHFSFLTNLEALAFFWREYPLDLATGDAYETTFLFLCTTRQSAE